MVSGTQTEILHVKSEPQIDTDKTFGYHHLIRQIYCLNLNRMSDSTDTDSDDDYTKIIFDDLCGDTIAEQTGVILETTEERMV